MSTQPDADLTRWFPLAAESDPLTLEQIAPQSHLLPPALRAESSTTAEVTNSRE